MKIEIQNWWNAKVWPNTDCCTTLSPKETLKQFGFITICSIVIDKKVVGCVKWDGQELTVSKELVEKDCPSVK